MCLAVPGELLDTRGQDLERTGRVSFGGVVREVSLACLPEVQVGDYVLVHAGLALSRLDADEARSVLGYVAEITAACDESPEGNGPSA